MFFSHSVTDENVECHLGVFPWFAANVFPGGLSDPGVNLIWQFIGRAASVWMYILSIFYIGDIKSLVKKLVQ